MAKILEFTATHFRGIVSTVTVELRRPSRPTADSLILYGDNGTGKSSLVDALEFGLRGRLSRRDADGRKVRREVRNLAVGGAPGVAVTLDNGLTVKRGGGCVDKPGVHPAEATAIIDGFQFSPITIRRQDIEYFWRVPENERQAFFFDYLRDYDAPSKADTPEALDEKRKRATEAHARAAVFLSKLSGVGSADLPKRHTQTRSFFERKLVPKFGIRQVGGRRRVPRRIHQAFLIFQSTLKEIEVLDQKIREIDTPEVISGRDLTQILQNTTDRVTAGFASISKLTWIKDVVILAGTQSQLSIRLVLANDREVDPVQVLSEASLDLLALLILVEVHIACAALGQSPVIVLDDVFQSVDTVNRVRTLDHILSRLSGWQIIFTLHDRLWLELVRRAMNRASHTYIAAEVLPGSFGTSPDLRNSAGSSAEQLRGLIERRDAPGVLASSSGRLLEELCETLSINLGCKIARRPGDRYTLGDLWPGVASSLRKHGSSPLQGAAEEVSKFVDLRNIAGAHYNEWAGSLADEEALEFARATLALWDASRCPSCGAFLSKFQSVDGKSEFYGFPCQCGSARQDVASPESVRGTSTESA